MRSSVCSVLLLALCAGLGCVSVGADFPAAPIGDLVVGETTQSQAQREFGAPWRTGVEDGRRTWTYGHYRYSLFGGAYARDLVLKWNERDVLASYTYATTEPDL